MPEIQKSVILTKDGRIKIYHLASKDYVYVADFANGCIKWHASASHYNISLKALADIVELIEEGVNNVRNQ